MPVKFNFNLCDNSPECSGMAVCEYEAIYWDNDGINALGGKGTLRIDNLKCVSCGKCVSDEGCPVGAIIFAKNEEGLAMLSKDTETDNNKVKALFVDRYGAEPVDESVSTTPDKLSALLRQGSGIVLVEEFADWSIQCLLSSIPIESIVQRVMDLTHIYNIQYYKCDSSESKSEDDNLPILKIYKGCNLIAQIDGYYDNTKFDDLITVLKKALG